MIIFYSAVLPSKNKTSLSVLTKSSFKSPSEF